MEKILVTGATGQLGTEVVRLLSDKIDTKSLSVMVRDTSKAESIKAKGVAIHKGDYNDYNSLVQAFKGIDKLFFISTNDFNNREKQHENVVNAAKEAKVKHIVYTSFQRKNESTNSPISLISNVHVYTDKLIKSSGLTYTILRNGLYADFIPVMLGDKVFESGTIYIPAGNGKVAFTSRSDMAEGAVAVLTQKGHENKTYEFSSESVYTFSDLAQILSKISGKSISYISPSPEEYKETLTKAGVPTPYIMLLAGCSEGIKQGEFDILDNTLSKIIGRKSTPLEDFLAGIYKN